MLFFETFLDYFLLVFISDKLRFFIFHFKQAVYLLYSLVSLQCEWDSGVMMALTVYLEALATSLTISKALSPSHLENMESQ